MILRTRTALRFLGDLASIAYSEIAREPGAALSLGLVGLAAVGVVCWIAVGVL